MALVLSQNWQLVIEGTLVFVISSMVYYLTLLFNDDAFISVVATFAFLGIYVTGTTINIKSIFKNESKEFEGNPKEETESVVSLVTSESPALPVSRESLFVLPDIVEKTVENDDLPIDALKTDEITVDPLAEALEEELTLTEEEGKGEISEEISDLPDLANIKGIFKHRCPFCKRDICIDVGEKKERLTPLPGNGLVEPTMKVDLSHTVNQKRHELEVQVSVWTLEYRTTMHRKKKTIINIEQASVTS